MTTDAIAAAFPPIGAYAMERSPLDPRRRDVYQIKAIRGRVPTSAGALVAPSPKITIAHVVHGERREMTIAEFFNLYRWEYAQ